MNRTLRFLLILTAACSLNAQSKKALLIGINTYKPSAAIYEQYKTGPGPVGKVAEVKTQFCLDRLKRPAAPGSWTAWQYENLKGAEADVEVMRGKLHDRGFETVQLLTQDATANAILSNLCKMLVEDAKAGDIRVVYYSGHGNFVRNLGNKEDPGNFDQSIVPWDHWRNTPDIRDKEISRILWQAADNGVIVSFIADSCHSGSLARGSWNPGGQVKTAKEAPPVEEHPKIDDPPGLNGKPIDPEARGVLVLTAAQSNEPAEEVKYFVGGKELNRGAFTLALEQALTLNPNQRADLVFQSMVGILKAENRTQQPTLGGRFREKKTIFGEPADDKVTAVTVSAESVDTNGIVTLRGGRAVGIYKGCRLKRLVKPELEIEVTEEVGLSASRAKIVGPIPAGQGPQKGQLFQVDKWVAGDEPALRIHIPPAAPAATVFQTAVEAARLKSDSTIVWLDDPTTDTPTHVMSWDAPGKQWIIEESPKRSDSPIKLGALPTAQAIRAKLPAKAKFLFLAPPTDKLAAALPFGKGDNTSIETVPSGDAATYIFRGRAAADRVEYAWVLRDSTEKSVRARVDANESPLPMPIRSDWIGLGGTDKAAEDVSSTLADAALRLGRLSAWLRLSAPSDSESVQNFPYRLVLKDVTNATSRREVKVGGLKCKGPNNDKECVVAGEAPMEADTRYKLALKADPASLKGTVAQRWVYVFAIDHYGKGSLLYPTLGHGNEGNQIPRKPDRFGPVEQVPEVMLSSQKYDFEVGAPYGVDTYILLTTEQPIDNPEVFEFDGVRSKGGSRGAESHNPLEALLLDVGTQSRSPKRAVPTDWSIERLTVRSVEKR